MNHSCLRAPSRAAGFTLVELMIVVAIVAILSAIAYPSYQEHVIKSRRATAQTCLLELAQFMERFYTTNMRYDQTSSGTPVTLPVTSCRTDLDAFYTFQFAAGQPQAATYVLEAVPKEAQKDPKCGTLGVNQQGVKSKSGTAASVNECWK